MAAASDIPTLVRELGSPGDDAVERAARQLLDLSNQSPASKSAVADAGGIHPLVRALGRNSAGVQEQAAGALWSLCANCPANKDSVVAAQGIQALVPLLSSNAAAVQKQAAGALWCIANGCDDRRAAVVAAGALPPLTQLLRHESPAQLQAVGALANLASASRAAVVGAVAAAVSLPAAVQLLRSSSESVQGQAACLLKHVAASDASIRDSIVPAGAVPLLVSLLSTSQDEEVQEHAAGAVAKLCSGSCSNSEAVVEAGGVPPLVRLLGSVEDESVLCQAAEALGSLACGGAFAQHAVVEGDAIAALTQLLGSSSEEVKAKAAGALEDIARGPHYKQAVAAAGAIHQLVHLLQHTFTDASAAVQEKAAAALVNLTGGEGDEAAAVAADGAIPALVQLLRISTAAGVQRHAAWVLRNLAADSPDCQNLIRSEGGIRPLVSLLFSSNTQVQEQAAGALANLCADNTANQVAVAAADSIPQLVQLLRDGSHAAMLRQAARALRWIAQDNPTNRRIIAEAGGAAALEQVRVSSNDERVKEAAAEALRELEGERSNPAQSSPSSPQPASPSDQRAAQPTPQPPRGPGSRPPNTNPDPLLALVTEQLRTMGQGRPQPAGAPQGLQDWQIQWEELEMGHILGQGSFGRVYCAEWGGTTVAVKLLTTSNDLQAGTAMSLSSPELAELRKEAGLMVRQRHPHCVSMLGVCAWPPAIITEYCELGCITDVIMRAQQDPVAARDLSWARRLGMALDAAKGMWYLHSRAPPVIHHDLKSPNLLVDAAWRVKVGDFNLSRLAAADPSGTLSAGMDRNPRWLAPEVLRGGPASIASDVFAFGVVMWELLTWRLPWEEVPVERTWEIPAKVVAGERLAVPERPQGADTEQFVGLDAYKALMRRCWAQEPGDRPTFEEVVNRIKHLVGAAGPPSAAAPQGAASPAAASASSTQYRECVICKDEVLPSEIKVLTPCGHRAACSGCTDELMRMRRRRCPICMQEIEHAIRVFSC